jgi:hypothetical protein
MRHCPINILDYRRGKNDVRKNDIDLFANLLDKKFGEFSEKTSKMTSDIIEKKITESDEKMRSFVEKRFAESDERTRDFVEKRFAESDGKIQVIMDEKITGSENLLLEKLDRVQEILISKMDKIEQNMQELQQYYRISKLENDNTALLLEMIRESNRIIEEMNRRIEKLEKRTA